DPGGRAAHETMDDGEILARVQLLPRPAEQHDRVPLGLPPRRQVRLDVVEQSHHGDHGRRRNAATVGLVVEADVAAHHGRVERQTRVANARDALLELPHDVGPLGVAVVETVAHGERTRTDRDDIARRLDHGEHGAEIGIEEAVATVAVDGEREAPGRPLDPDNGRIAAGAYRRVAADKLVVLAIYPLTRAEVRAFEELQQD